jgi:hypothetical protein
VLECLLLCCHHTLSPVFFLYILLRLSKGSISQLLCDDLFRWNTGTVATVHVPERLPRRHSAAAWFGTSDVGHHWNCTLQCVVPGLLDSLSRGDVVWYYIRRNLCVDSDSATARVVAAVVMVVAVVTALVVVVVAPVAIVIQQCVAKANLCCMYCVQVALRSGGGCRHHTYNDALAFNTVAFLLPLFVGCATLNVMILALLELCLSFVYTLCITA